MVYRIVVHVEGGRYFDLELTDGKEWSLLLKQIRRGLYWRWLLPNRLLFLACDGRAVMVPYSSIVGVESHANKDGRSRFQSDPERARSAVE